MKIKFLVNIHERAIIPENDHWFNHHLDKLEGKKLWLHLEDLKKQRSLKQNAYYWGVVIPLIADEIGEHDHNYVHALMKHRFLTKKKVIKNKVYEATGSTRKLNTNQFNIFMDKVIHWANTELGLQIPPPDKEYSYGVRLAEED